MNMGCGELFRRRHFVITPGIEVRRVPQVPQTWLANSLKCNDDFEKLNKMLV